MARVTPPVLTPEQTAAKQLAAYGRELARVELAPNPSSAATTQQAVNRMLHQLRPVIVASQDDLSKKIKRQKRAQLKANKRASHEAESGTDDAEQTLTEHVLDL
jgi:hypothetical protein